MNKALLYLLSRLSSNLPIYIQVRFCPLFQAKALIILPNAIAVYCTTSGVALWEKHPEEEILSYRDYDDYAEYAPQPFITKDIAGYFLQERSSSPPSSESDQEYSDSSFQEGGEYDWTSSTEWAKLRVYDTNSGDLIATERIYADFGGDFFDEYWASIKARGRLLCSEDVYGKSLHVFEVVGREVRKHKFAFPIDYFINNRQLSSSDKVNWIRMEIMGFLSKTNVLVGNILFVASPDSTDNFYYMLFTLDVDAGIAARDASELNLAFSIPPACKTMGSPEHKFNPVCKTDQVSKRVELIGVMRGKNDDANDVVTVENGFFVTEMQCSNIY